MSEPEVAASLPRHAAVAVVGAGITGLTAALHLARGGADVVVLEAADRVGGTIETRRHDTAEGHWSFETGPNTVLDGHPEVGELIAAAGLEGERLAADRAGQRRYVWKDGALVPLPGGPRDLVRTSLLSTGAKLRLLREPFVGRGPAARAGGRGGGGRGGDRRGGDGRGGDARGGDPDDESIADFTRRRLGRQVLDFAVAPFVSGVYAGDPERLSVRWALPRLAGLEADHGSLVRGLLTTGWARRQERRREQRTEPGDAGAGRRAGEAESRSGEGDMISFRDGLDTLPRRLAEEIEAAGGRVFLGVACERILRAAPSAGDGLELEPGLELETPAGRLTAAHVVLTVAADAAAALLDEATAGDSAALAEVPYAPVAVATLGVPRDALAHPLDGFGFLVPRRQEGRPAGVPAVRLLGCLFPSSFFPGRAPAGHAALTAFAGGRTDPQALDLPDHDLLALFRRDLETTLGLAAGTDPFRGLPVTELRRWPRAIPQYELGHGRFAALRERLQTRLPGLHLAGSYLDGVSVPDRIRHATGLARRLLAAG